MVPKLTIVMTLFLESIVLTQIVLTFLYRSPDTIVVMLSFLTSLCFMITAPFVSRALFLPKMESAESQELLEKRSVIFTFICCVLYGFLLVVVIYSLTIYERSPFTDYVIVICSLWMALASTFLLFSLGSWIYRHLYVKV